MNSVVLQLATRGAGEAAIHKLAAAGLDMRRFSLLGQIDAGEEHPPRFLGGESADWGSLWGVLTGGVVLPVPGIGTATILGQLASAVFSALAGTPERGKSGALDAALRSRGLSDAAVSRCGHALRAHQWLILVHGPAAEVDRARLMLQLDGAAPIDLHAPAPQAKP